MPRTLLQLSEDLAAIVDLGGRSVLRIEGRRGRPSSGVAWSTDGIVVTSNHTLEWDEGIKVGLASGETLTAALIGRDPSTDLAALRLSASLVPPSWSPPESTKVGHVLVAVMRPGKATRAGLGLLSARAEAWRAPAGGRLDLYLETDVAVRAGFSGALVVDAALGPIGVGTAGLLRGTGLVIPAPTIERVVTSLLSYGQVRRGFLGIGTCPAHLPSALQEQVGQESALLLVSVEPASPAEKAGLLLGDAVLSVDGTPLRHPGELLPFLEEERIDTEAILRIVRAGEIREMKITIGSRDKPRHSR